MDIKSKKWKKIVSYITLLLGGGILFGMLVNLIFGFGPDLPWHDRERMAEVIGGDYQNTADFRWAVCDYLEDFIAMALKRPLSGSREFYDREQEDAGGFEITATATDAAEYLPDGGTITYSYSGGDDVYGGKMEEEEREEWESWIAKEADSLHNSLKNDKNMLYSISSGAETLYSNTDGQILNEKTGEMPEGYNFMLYFDGEKVTIYKDGKGLDVYGDGLYRESSDWYVPGYRNFQTDEELRQVRICMAFTKEPLPFIGNGYANYNYDGPGAIVNDKNVVWYSRNGHLYNVSYGKNGRFYEYKSYLDRQRDALWMESYVLAAGAALLLISQLLRKARKEAMRELALMTGKLWFEGKAVAAAATLLGCFSLYYYSYWEYGAYASLFLSELSGCILFTAITLVWNDFRINPKVWRSSLLGELAGLNGSDEDFPIRKKMLIRLKGLVVTAALFWLLSAAGVGFLLVIFYEDGAPALLAAAIVLLFVGITAALYAVLFSFVKYFRRNIVDTEELTGQITAVHDGDYSCENSLSEESDLYPAMEQLKEIRQGMDSAVAEKVKSERMKVELVSNVSHDIKTPLTSIISYLDLLRQETGLPDYVKDYVQILDQKAQRLKAMVQDVFEISKAASGQLPVNTEKLDLGKLLRQTLADMAEQIDQSLVTVKTSLPEEAVTIEADGNRLYRVFQNLLVNALHYSLDGSRVYVTLKADCSMAVASVKNTSKTELNNGMDYTGRFTRGDESRSDGGSGLGLSIAKSFTEACGGRLTVETIADLFVVTAQFPICEDASDGL